MTYVTLGHRLPRFFSRPLFGDRQTFGKVADREDACWKEWERTYLEFYSKNQRAGVGKVVNEWGYRIVSEIDLGGRVVFELGPGEISHLPYWSGRPAKYVILDNQPSMLSRSRAKLQSFGVSPEEVLLDSRVSPLLPLERESFDVFLSFYCLEHLHPLDTYLDEIAAKLKPGGLFVGAIPCEGGLAWGMGRALTSRRWLLRNTTINPDKIICWEHPNFAEEIMTKLERKFVVKTVRFSPLGIRSIDLNLIVSFILQKEGAKE